MPIHTTPPPHADQTDQTAEPARRASRFDERGIALQTIIIMVVLLAIAGSVAAVLLNRAGQETANLEGGVSSTAYGITNKQGCDIGGYEWRTSLPNGNEAKQADRAGLIAAGRANNTGDANAIAGKGYCKPKT